MTKSELAEKRRVFRIGDSGDQSGQLPWRTEIRSETHTSIPTLEKLRQGDLYKSKAI